jgi:hypothetical protein
VTVSLLSALRSERARAAAIPVVVVTAVVGGFLTNWGRSDLYERAYWGCRRALTRRRASGAPRSAGRSQ